MNNNKRVEIIHHRNHRIVKKNPKCIIKKRKMTEFSYYTEEMP